MGLLILLIFREQNLSVGFVLIINIFLRSAWSSWYETDYKCFSFNMLNWFMISLLKAKLKFPIVRSNSVTKTEKKVNFSVCENISNEVPKLILNVFAACSTCTTSSTWLFGARLYSQSAFRCWPFSSSPSYWPVWTSCPPPLCWASSSPSPSTWPESCTGGQSSSTPFHSSTSSWYTAFSAPRL